MLTRTKKVATKKTAQKKIVQLFKQPAVGRSSETQIVKIRRGVTLTTFTTSNAAETKQGYSFQLSDLPGYSELQTTFDAYRFVGVEVKFVPINVVNVSSNGPNPNWFITAFDYDNVATNLLTTDLQQYDTHRFHMQTGNRIVTLKLVPRCTLAAYSGAFTSYAEAKEKQWVDCASPSIQHYGLLATFPTASAAAAEQTYNVVATYYLEFKRQR